MLSAPHNNIHFCVTTLVPSAFYSYWSRVFHPPVYDRPAFSSPAFSVVPIHLLCAEQNLPQVLRHRLNTYGRPRAFAIAGPAAWNSLPDPVRNSNSTKAAFGRQIKHFCTLGTSARSALGASTGDALYKSILFDFSLACISAFREY